MSVGTRSIAGAETNRESRTYGGVPLAQRRAERRRRFMDAAIEVVGTQGYAATSVTELCKAAGLSRRQFYDEFGDREELLLAVYDDILDTALADVRAALAETPVGTDVVSVATAAMTAFMTSITVDRRRATLVYVAVVGVSERVEAHRLARRQELVAFLQGMVNQYVPDRVRRTRPEEQMAAVGFIGAITAVLHTWSTTTGRRPRATTVAATLARMLVAQFGY